jgi:predicted transcriptional regulator
MSKNNAASLQLDHTHCRAICDEIGERLGQFLRPQVSAIPQHLLALIEKLKQSDLGNCIQLEHAPSIAPSFDEMPFHQSRTLVAAD